MGALPTTYPRDTTRTTLLFGRVSRITCTPGIVLVGIWLLTQVAARSARLSRRSPGARATWRTSVDSHLVWFSDDCSRAASGSLHGGRCHEHRTSSFATCCPCSCRR